MTGDVFRERGGEKIQGVVGQPVGAVHGHGAFARTAPGADLFSFVKGSDRGDGPDKVIGPFAVPGGDTCVAQCVAECEEHADIIVFGVFALMGDELADFAPDFRRGEVRAAAHPEFADHFLFIGQVGAVAEHFFHFGLELCRRMPGWRRRAELRAVGQREGFDLAPMGREELLDGGSTICFGYSQRLPMCGFFHFVGGIERRVPGVVGIPWEFEGSELVGAVAVGLIDDELGRDITDALRGLGVEGIVVGVIPQLFHVVAEQVLFVCGQVEPKERGEHPVRRVAECLSAVIGRVFFRGLFQGVAGGGAPFRFPVVAPCVEHGGVQQSEGAGHVRRRGRGEAHGVLGQLVPFSGGGGGGGGEEHEVGVFVGGGFESMIMDSAFITGSDIIFKTFLIILTPVN